VQGVSAVTLSSGNIYSSGLNATLRVDFSVTFDQLSVNNDSITFYNLSYVNPSSCNSQSSSYATYNFTTSNINETMSSALPSIACTTIPSDNTGGSSGGGGAASSGSSSGNSHAVVFSTVKNVPTNVNLTPVSDVLSKFLVTANQTVASASVTLSDINVSSGESPLFADGKIYRSYSFVPAGVGDFNLDNVLIYFNVNKSWFSDGGLNLSSLTMYRKPDVAGSTWIGLPTSLLGNDSLVYDFVALSSGFSNYTIFAHYNANVSATYSGNDTSTGVRENQTSGSSPIGNVAKNILSGFKTIAGKVGYWAILVLVVVIILAVVYFVFRDWAKRHNEKLVKRINNRI